jgi:glycosyltransferase involved in cell wall biosynthesis
MDVGGAEVLVDQLCRLQRAAGARPAIHCLLHKGVLGERLEQDGVPVSAARPGRMGRLLHTWNIVRSLRPDIVHCHNAYAAIQAAALARFAGVKGIVVTRHGLVVPGEYRARERKFWMAARFCDRVIGVCEVTRQNLLNATGVQRAKVLMIRNGAMPAAEGSFQPDKSGFTLIHVARLNPIKDQALLLEAFSRALSTAPELRLWIVGDGPLRAELERLAGQLGILPFVSFLGERSDVGSWLRAADVFVLSSRSEGLPVSVIEAMAAGTPMILTDVGGMPEMAALGGGVVVPSGNSAALAAAIVEMSRRADLHRLGEANRRAYQSHLTLDAMANAYWRVYAELAR